MMDKKQPLNYSEGSYYKCQHSSFILDGLRHIIYLSGLVLFCQLGWMLEAIKIMPEEARIPFALCLTGRSVSRLGKEAVWPREKPWQEGWSEGCSIFLGQRAPCKDNVWQEYTRLKLTGSGTQLLSHWHRGLYSRSDLSARASLPFLSLINSKERGFGMCLFMAINANGASTERWPFSHWPHRREKSGFVALKWRPPSSRMPSPGLLWRGF